MLAIKGGSGVRGDVDRALHPATRRIEGVQLVTRRKPDMLTVVGHAMHLAGPGEGAIFTEDLGL